MPESYIVQDNDSLWDVAGQFLNDPERWSEVWLSGPYLDNSDFIYPGDEVRVSYVDGAPRILVLRGGREDEELGPVMREQVLSSAIPAIPLEAIENSSTLNRIVSQTLLEDAPYIVSNIGDALAIATGDEVHARGEWPAGTTLFEVYRPFREHYDDDDDIMIGIEVKYVGFASIAAVESADLRRLLINSSDKEIRVGDRLLVREETTIAATIFPSEPTLDIEGRIVAFLGTNRWLSSWTRW